MTTYDISEVLPHIDPTRLDYQSWVNVGMALKDAGHPVSDWDAWSQRDAARYRPGECEKKWAGFRGAPNPVTAGTIVQMARDQGWEPQRDEGYALDWDSVIGARDEQVIVDANWIESKDVPDPEHWDPAAQLTRYLELLFEASETVGYVTESWEKEGRYLPTKGAYDRTAGQLIEQLSKCKGDIGAVVGDYKAEAGAWIRFNPLDGKGVKNENVTEYRFALVESDAMPIEQQYAIIHELELPVAVLVHSGKKSLHAIVRIDAANYDEYRKRVDYLYTVCQKNGLKIDSQNRNPSRLSRMPGAVRDGRKQFIVAENMGKANYDQWHEWIEGVNDDLPEPESMRDAWDNLPPLSPALIDGVLRQGHKMLLAGPSKAGKSYALIELCIAIAEGRKWMSWPCARGKVMYVNLELDRASCLHRFRDVYQVLGWQPAGLDNIDVWNLRGKAIPMDKLAPKLIRRAAKRGYIAIVIDPIYKVITGDENSADQMANFCNQFDKVCTELGCAVIYCHHHSKGQQGQKRSMDRASGSGVFARDPDAMLDMIELEPTETLTKQEGNKAVCAVAAEWLNRCATVTDWAEYVS
ncbi:MAG: AAA family ATPase, partial [Christensenellaceae bacterium]|nr:AAA family ATPase [Christensenellaceae bacterium]